jgi:hypothetical protein
MANMLREFIGNRTSGLLLATENGKPLSQSNILKRSLHPILKAIKHEKGGLYIFRRFRITQFKKSECPEFLEHSWSGHTQTHVSEGYTKLNDREFRLGWADKIGLGFDLPAPTSKHGKPHVLARSA